MNRSVTEIYLQLYEKAVNDAETALKLNEDSLKGWLLMAKAYSKLGNREKCENAIAEAKKRNPERVDVVEGINNKSFREFVDEKVSRFFLCRV